MYELLQVATEAGGHHLDFVGKMRGAGVVFFALILFCGSIYMVLATNVGSKLAFLISFASICAFMTQLGMVWSTSLFPLNALHGPAPHWQVEEVVGSPEKAEPEPVQDITKEGLVPEIGVISEVKASVDGALTDPEGEFGMFTKASEYLVTNTYTIGGEKKNPFQKKPAYALAEVRPVLKVKSLPGQAPPRPVPDPDADVSYVVLIRDLGAMRLPQYITVLAFGLLFLVSLGGLHKLERSQQAKDKAKEQVGTDLEPVPA